MTELKSNVCRLFTLCLGLALASPLQAQSVQITDRSLLVPGDTIEVVAGARYQAGWLHRWFFGGARRAVWNQPVRIPVLDLDAHAGGITAFRTGGLGQTNTLHFLKRGQIITVRIAVFSCNEDKRKWNQTHIGHLAQTIPEGNVSLHSRALVVIRRHLIGQRHEWNRKDGVGSIKQ